MLIIKKIDDQQSFYHDTKLSMYREAKNTQTNIEKEKKEIARQEDKK